jgi:predicted metal-dependent phosphoesterase TrpH
MYENLHSHTFLSDGKMTHEETLDVAAANGCGVVAFTEHDILMPVAKYEELKKLENTTKWISGIELSTTVRESSDGKTGAHIIGLFVDPANEELQKKCKIVQETRVKKVHAVAENFRSLGLKFDENKCFAIAGDGSVGKPHVVETLISEKENLPLINKYIEQFRIASEKDTALAEDYKEASDRSKLYGISQFIYPIFLRQNALVPGVYKDYNTEPDLAETVELIHNAGGVALLAHWHTVRRTMSLELVRDLLRNKKIDGAEIRLGLKDPSWQPAPGVEGDYPALERIVEEVGALASYSIDAHYTADYEVYSRDKAFAEATVGATRKIIEKSGVSTQHSSLV